MTLEKYLSAFHPISDSDFELLTSKFRERSFKKGENIIVPGQIQKALYFVKSGVQMSYFDAGKKPHVMAFTYAPGPCAIPDSFSFQVPSTYFLTCMSDSEMDYLTFDDVQQLFDASQQIERLFRRMTEFILAGMINRHMELHAMTMEERYVTFCRRSPHLLQLIPHKYLASYLGIDATNFSKLFNKVKF